LAEEKLLRVVGQGKHRYYALHGPDSGHARHLPFVSFLE
jgi:hypothetical protein